MATSAPLAYVFCSSQIRASRLFDIVLVEVEYTANRLGRGLPFELRKLSRVARRQQLKELRPLLVRESPCVGLVAIEFSASTVFFVPITIENVPVRSQKNCLKFTHGIERVRINNSAAFYAL